MTERLECMFDTVAFNRAVEGNDSVESIAQFVDVFATHVQYDEINQTKCPQKLAELRRVFAVLVADDPPWESERLIPTESAVWDISRWDLCRWAGEDSQHEPMKAALDNRRKKFNNIHDALIAETALIGGLTLITNDVNLAEVTEEFGGLSMSWEQLREHCGI